MSQPDQGVDGATGAASDARLAALRALGAGSFDPVTMRFLEAMARRAASQGDAVRRVVDARIEQAATSLQARLEQARTEAGQMLAVALERYPQWEESLRPHATAGDVPGFKRALMQLQAQAQGLSLAALTRELGQEMARHGEAAAGRAELKTVRTARTTWSRLSADKQVAQALAQAPKNAGPINSHMLMLRSLELMREISPEYLHRFISYADTLLRLDESGPAKAEKAEKTEKAKKAKTPRARASRSRATPKL